MKLFAFLFPIFNSFSFLAKIENEAYDNSVYRKKFQGFTRHSNNPNYARLPGNAEKISDFRRLTDEELEMMDNTHWNNKQSGVEKQPDSQSLTSGTETTTTTTTTEEPTTTTRRGCLGDEIDVYDSCALRANRCYITSMKEDCAYTCNKCHF